MLSPFRCVIYLMMSFPSECVPLSYVSYVLHCLLDCVPSLDMASAFYCQVHPGYVFILCGLCFILSFRFGKLFTIRFVICFILSTPPVMWPFMLWFLGFILSGVCHMFYIVMYTLCFILSHVVFYVLLYIVYSDCYLHPMCHYVSSCHVHPGYVILFHVLCFQIVLSIPWPVELIQPDGQNVQSQFAQNQILWYATPPTKSP